MVYNSRARSKSTRRGPRSQPRRKPRSKVNIRKVLVKRKTKTQREVNQVLKMFLYAIHSCRTAVRRAAKALARPINFSAGLAYVILDCLLLGAFFVIGSVSYLLTILITRVSPEAAGAGPGPASINSHPQVGKKQKQGKGGKNTKTKKKGSTASDEPPEGPMWYVTTFYKMVEDRVKRGELGEASATLSGDIHFNKHKRYNLGGRQASAASLQEEEGSYASVRDEEGSYASVKDEEGSAIRRQSSVRGQGSGIRRQSSVQGEGSIIKRLSVKVSEIMDDVAGVMQTFDNEEKIAHPDPEQSDNDSSE